ncbi:MAG TPA: hypothetical protein VMB53_09160 [Gaiellaceae bacterium]|nr:hypothetical protein [Gaiellaceae bacterium]
MIRLSRLVLLAVFVLLVCGWTEYWRVDLAPRIHEANLPAGLFVLVALAVFAVPLLAGGVLVVRFYPHAALEGEVERPRRRLRARREWSVRSVAASLIAGTVRLILLAVPVALVVAWTTYWRLDLLPRVQHSAVSTTMVPAVAFAIFVAPLALGALTIFLLVCFLRWRYVVRETRRIDDLVAPLRAAGLEERDIVERDQLIRAATADTLVVRTDRTGSLYHAVGTQLALLLVENSTPEPDGSVKHYILRVPTWVTSPIAAVAWTFGLTVHEYAPAHES